MLKHVLPWLGLPLMLGACEHSATAPAKMPGAEGAALQVPSADRLVASPWPSSTDPGVPYYARIEPAPSHFYIVNGLAVIAFYRDPGCIREDFNLLAFFDAPAAFGCSLTVEGFSLWEGEPFGGGAPKISQALGMGAVPFWFIPADVVLDAAQDGMLTIGELAALPGRITGSATEFSETLHPGAIPLPPPLGGGGHPHPAFIQTARGTLEDGRSFEYHVTTVKDELVDIRLRIQ